MTGTTIDGIFGKIVFYFAIFYLCLKLLKGFYTCFLANALGLGVVWKPSPNAWAVITGGLFAKGFKRQLIVLCLATDGIGLQYSKRLAGMGYSLLIISRSEDKLQKVKNDILDENPKCTDIKTLTVDFTKADIWDDIEREVKALEVIDVLVNNVGMSFKTGEYLTKIENLKQFIVSIINCNIISMTKMIAFVLPQMVSRRHGVIINLSSLSATYPVPLLSIYSATKVFCDYLSQSLHFEYKDKGVVIQSVLPGFVATNMSKMRPSFLCPSPDHYVNETLKTVGIESRTYGHYAHKLQGFIQDSITRWLGSDVNSRIAFNHMKNIRIRFYKKNGLKVD